MDEWWMEAARSRCVLILITYGAVGVGTSRSSQLSMGRWSRMKTMTTRSVVFLGVLRTMVG